MKMSKVCINVNNNFARSGDYFFKDGKEFKMFFLGLIPWRHEKEPIVLESGTYKQETIDWNIVFGEIPETIRIYMDEIPELIGSTRYTVKGEKGKSQRPYVEIPFSEFQEYMNDNRQYDYQISAGFRRGFALSFLGFLMLSDEFHYVEKTYKNDDERVLANVTENTLKTSGVKGINVYSLLVALQRFFTAGKNETFFTKILGGKRGTAQKLYSTWQLMSKHPELTVDPNNYRSTDKEILRKLKDENFTEIQSYFNNPKRETIKPRNVRERQALVENSNNAIIKDVVGLVEDKNRMDSVVLDNTNICNLFYQCLERDASHTMEMLEACYNDLFEHQTV